MKALCQEFVRIGGALLNEEVEVVAEESRQLMVFKVSSYLSFETAGNDTLATACSSLQFDAHWPAIRGSKGHREGPAV